jgi:hypothetical protein
LIHSQLKLSIDEHPCLLWLLINLHMHSGLAQNWHNSAPLLVYVNTTPMPLTLRRVWHGQRSWFSKRPNHGQTFYLKIFKHLLCSNTWCTYRWGWCSQRHQTHNHFTKFVYECVSLLAILATLYMFWTLEQNYRCLESCILFSFARKTQWLAPIV